jgi:hypothetical protein
LSVASCQLPVAYKQKPELEMATFYRMSDFEPHLEEEKEMCQYMSDCAQKQRFRPMLRDTAVARHPMLSVLVECM